MALKFLISALAAVAFTFSAVPASADAKGLEIAKQAARIGNGWRDFRVSGEMTLSGRGGATGTRRFNMSAVSSGGVEKTLLVFEWPGAVGC